jgi:hypothetical protein
MHGHLLRPLIRGHRPDCSARFSAQVNHAGTASATAFGAALVTGHVKRKSNDHRFCGVTNGVSATTGQGFCTWHFSALDECGKAILIAEGSVRASLSDEIDGAMLNWWRRAEDAKMAAGQQPSPSKRHCTRTMRKAAPIKRDIDDDISGKYAHLP